MYISSRMLNIHVKLFICISFVGEFGGSNSSSCNSHWGLRGLRRKRGVISLSDRTENIISNVTPKWWMYM